MRTRRSAPMPAEYHALLEEISRRLEGLPEPREQGRVIGIRRRSPAKPDPGRIPVGV